MSTTFSIVIPAKNEQATISNVIKKIKSLHLDNALLKEVILVDDGSTDDTAKEASVAGAKVISHPYSKGNGAAIKTGARTAQGDVIVFMDADGQHNPEDIPRLINKLNEGYDLVVGARQKGSQASIGRSIANKIYNTFASYMTGHKVEDLTSGFRVVRANKFKKFLSLLPNGFSYPTTSTMAFFRAGYSVAYEPIHTSQREDESSSHINILKDGLRFLLIIFKVGTLYSPLKLFLPVSVAVFLTGLSYYCYTFFSSGRFTNMSALMFSTSLIIFMVGLVSEQITALMYKDSE
ncbi:glycosyltransferase family 2 protein [Thalassotalea piscium]